MTTKDYARLENFGILMSMSMSMSILRCLLMLDVAWESFTEKRNFCRTTRVTSEHG
jgi:hypothetical protein